MTNVDIGHYGATRQSWRAKSPRDLLRKLLNENPNFDHAALLSAFEKIVKSDDDYLNVIIEYWFTNNHRSLTSGAGKRDVAAVKRKVQSAKTHLVKKIDQVARVMMLDLTMPNGKRLADCTGAECLKFGGWYLRIGKKVGLTQRVGDVLSERQLLEILQ